MDMVKKVRLAIFFLLVIAVFSTSYAAYYFYKKSMEVATQAKQSKVEQTQTPNVDTPAGLVEVVGKLIVLPVGEEPTIATVSDPSKLKDQPFFANAEVGDKVLIYQKAKQAYLYSVSLNKLVEVAPINVGQSTTSTTTPKIVNTPIKKK